MTFRCPAQWRKSRPTGDDVRALVASIGTQAEVADMLGVGRAAVGHWCSGARRIKWPAWRLLVEFANGGGDE